MTERMTGPVWQAGKHHIEQRPLFHSPHHMTIVRSTCPFTKATMGTISKEATPSMNSMQNEMHFVSL
jgi:hypothetical protein